jgi:hypothetical protein
MAPLLHEFPQQINENMQKINRNILTTKFNHHVLQLGKITGRSNQFYSN